MALKFGPDKRKGARKRTTIDPRRGGKAGDAAPKFQREGKQPRTTIDPRIGGTKGDAGFAGKAGKSGLGVAPGNAIAKAKRAKNRTKIDPRIGGQKGDAGFAGKKKSIAPGSFKEAFAVAYAKGPGTLFTFKGKKYKAIKKHEGKGPSKSRVEDKSIGAGTIIKGKRDTTKSKNPVATTKTVTKKKKPLRPLKFRNLAGQKFGQRKAGGQIKKMAYGGMAKKKMMGGGMAMKYGHGGMTKKCPRDGIAMKGKTRA
jgi:hypothetical protein